MSIDKPVTEEAEDPFHLWCPNQSGREGQIVASSVPMSVGRMIVLTCTFDGDESLDDWDD
jgi:hypothetical protein